MHAAKLRKKIMPVVNPQNEATILAHWHYTRLEWKCFIRYSMRSRGRLRYIRYYLFGPGCTVIPEITITGQKVWTGDAAVSFNDVNRYIKRICIHDSGKINILEITYAILENGNTHSGEIVIPIPKGKLKEAIQVQENLVAGTFQK
jgi:hypothetical protein